MGDLQETITAVANALTFDNAQGILASQWQKFLTAAGPHGGVGPAEFLGYTGGALAFLLSLLGGVSNAGQTIFWVEDGLDDWFRGYGQGRYDEVLKDVDYSNAMQTFLNYFNWDLIAFSAASMFHSVFIIGTGYLGAYNIFNKIIEY